MTTNAPSRAGAGIRALGWAAILLLAGAGLLPGQMRATQAPPEPSSGRPPDHLLEDPALQALVDAQVEREAAPLVAALDDSDPAVRARAAFALGSVQDPTAVPALLAALQDPEPRVREDAAFALGQTVESTVSARLLEAWEGETAPAVRRRLLEALGKTGGRASLLRVASLAVGPEEREALALALGRYGLRDLHERAAVQRLVDMLPRDLQDALAPAEETAVSASAAWYFGRARDTTDWSFAADDLRRALDAVFLAQSARATGMATEIGVTPSRSLLAALGRLGDHQDDERLIDWLESAADWRAQVEAARALAGRTDRESVRRALLEAARDPSVHVAVEAARALSAADSLPLETQRTISQRYLTHALPWQVAAAFSPAIVKSGGSGVVLLVLTGIAHGRTNDQPAYRADLLEALGQDDGRPGWLMLRFEAGNENPRIGAAALAGLAERWRRGYRGGEATTEEYYRLFAAGLERNDPATTSAAAGPLADPRFLPLGATALLGRVLREQTAPRDLESMIEIVGALGRTGDPAAEPALREALGARQPLLRRAAADALAELLGHAVDLPQVEDPPERRVDWTFLRAVGARPRLVLETERGRVVVELDTEEAPLTVQTVLQLAEQGRYDESPFHRVVPDFVVQGGDFERGDGYGGPGYAIRSEFTLLPFERGVIGIASAGKDTEGSQFFLMHSAQPHLDGRYTGFGRVVQGMEVVDRLLEGDRVERASVQVRSEQALGGRP